MNFTDKMSSPHRLLIVGAGLTGSVTASLLRRRFPRDVLNITVWEKSRGAGGRMTTNRNPSDPRCTADLGAQYVSATSAYAKSHERQVAYISLIISPALTSLCSCRAREHLQFRSTTCNIHIVLSTPP